MDIIITNNSDYPIYAQIKDQIKTMILNGELKEGDALPSMRLLSRSCVSASSPRSGPMRNWSGRDTSSPILEKAAL